MKTLQNLSQDAQQQIQTIHWLLTSPSRQQQLYRTAFTEEEREKLFTPEQRAALIGPAAKLDLTGLKIDLLQTWREKCGHQIPRSDLVLAYHVDLITESTYRWLMEELEEDLPERPTPLTPVWDLQAGELRLGDMVVRRISNTDQAPNIVAILNEFQVEGWPNRVDSPIANSTAPLLRDSVRNLNQGLQILRFESDGTGKGIRWSLLAPKC